MQFVIGLRLDLFPRSFLDLMSSYHRYKPFSRQTIQHLRQNSNTEVLSLVNSDVDRSKADGGK